jgi:hypothetical protein
MGAANNGSMMERKMPRKPRLSYYSVIKPEDGDEVDDYDLVRATLFDFEELAHLPSAPREQLVTDLVDAIRFWRAGVKPGKRGLSDEKEAQHIFISDVGRALKRAGLFATRWRKTYEGDGPDIDAPESFFFRLARGLADAFGRALPKDLKLAGQRASKIQYGVMFPAMKAAQDAEVAARRRRLAGVWGDSLVGVPRSCGELASAYLGFPF